MSTQPQAHACGYLLTPLSRVVQIKARVLETGAIVQARGLSGQAEA